VDRGAVAFSRRRHRGGARRARDGKGESERWKKIAACVPGKDAKQCHERYKAMKEEMRAAKAGRE
jgi:hypothetical protein